MIVNTLDATVDVGYWYTWYCVNHRKPKDIHMNTYLMVKVLRCYKVLT